MTKVEKAVITKAVQWFNSHRPLSASSDYHLTHPWINQVSGSSGQQLADAVARYLKTLKKKAPA